jgi:uncharacterized membrane protein (UPF0127 family)/CheY-like chemotaxis protein
MRGRGTLTLRRDDGRIVCETVVVADRWARRLRGLLGRRRLDPGQGLLLRPSFSIHTAFMRFPIDVVFLDHDLVVLKIDAALRPFRTASCRGAREVVELAPGECARRGLTVGDRVAWASQATIAPAMPGAPHALAETGAMPRGRVILASRDARFVKLTRFLLDGQGIETVTVVPSEKLSDALETEEDVDVVLLDAQDRVAAGLAVANAARSLKPEIPILIAGETRAAERSPTGVRIYDKWNETDDLIAAVEQLLEDEGVDPEASPLGRGA